MNKQETTHSHSKYWDISENYAVIDFETRSDYDLKEVSFHNPKYFSGNFKVLCMAVKFKGGPTQVFYKEEIIQQVLIKILKSKIPVIACNADFEYTVIRRLLRLHKALPFLNFISIDLLSRYAGGPSGLDDMLQFWKISDKKYAMGKQLIKILSLPYSKKTPKKYGFEFEITKEMLEGKFIENEFLLSEMGKYCKIDVEVTEKILLKLKNLIPEMLKQEVHVDNLLNYARNSNGLKIDTELGLLLLNELEDLKKVFDIKAKRLTQNKEFNINSYQQCLAFMQSLDKRIELTGKDYLKFFLQTEKDIPDKLKEFINLKIYSPKGVGKKTSSLIEPINYDGFRLFGTHQTRRFTSYNLNILNLPRITEKLDINTVFHLHNKNMFLSTFKENSFNVIKSLIRPCIIARNKFYGGDFSQIEFRLLMLAAGEHKILEKLFSNWDAYIFIAKNLYRKKEINKQERYICKRITLARGYGIGEATIGSTLKDDGINVTIQEIRKIKDIYDNTFPRVRRYWQKMETEFYQSKGQKLQIPYSKRNQYFPFSRYYKGEHSKRKQWHILTKKGYKSMWGGSLTGLNIQGLQSDVFAAKSRDLYKELRLLVDIPFHDEVVIDSPNLDIKQFKKVFMKTPDFLPVKLFPYLEADFWTGSRYLKE